MNIFNKLRTCSSSVIVPNNLKGIHEAAEKAKHISYRYPEHFYNVANRDDVSTDAEYVGIVISILKKRCGKNGIIDAISLIEFLEKANAN